MKKVLILGSSKYFENMIDSAKEKGIKTVVCDGIVGSLSKKKADEFLDIDINEIEKIQEEIMKKSINGIFTGFTDSLIDSYTKLTDINKFNAPMDNLNSKKVTNKTLMKDIFKKNNIKTSKYIVVLNPKDLNYAKDLKFPIIIKPSDGSGSKGIYIVNKFEELSFYYNKAKSHSINKNIIIEEFYEGDEVQGMAWIYNKEVHLMYIGDREIINIHKNRPGKPRRLVYPSKYYLQYEDEFKKIYNLTAQAFDLENGPLYIQMLVGNEGIKVVEVTTRFPGGCDYLILKHISGFDVNHLMLDYCVGNKINFEKVKQLDIKKNEYAFVLPIYLKSGKVKDIMGLEEIKNMEEVVEIFLNIPKYVEDTGDMKHDCGRIFLVAKNIYNMDYLTKIVHSKLKIFNENYENMIDNFERK